MKLRSRRLLFIALGLFAVACVLRAPVSLLTLFLPQNIQLQNVQGSLWSGSASALGVGNLIVQEQLEWRFRPRTVLSGGLEWQFTGRFGEKSSGLRLILRPSGAELKQLSVYLPLEPFVALHPRLKALPIGALLHGSTASIQPNTAGSAVVEVEGLFSPLVPQSSQLGNYRADLEIDAAGKGQWRLSTLSGILAATGEGSFDTRAAKVGGQLVLTPRSTLPGLSPALSQLPRSGEGYLVAF